MKHLLLFLLLAAPLHAQDAEKVLRKWISKQSAIRSLRADFIQTRRLPALRIPLKKSGTVWFGTEGRFRWQVGDPAEMIVLKSPTDFLVIEPKKSLARRLNAASAAARAMQELPMPIAISLAEFQRRFEVVSLKAEGEKMDLCVVPKDPRLAEGLKSLRILFEPATGAVALFEMTFRDGSEVSTEFTHIERNPSLPAELFRHDLRDFKIEDQS
jgi:outer membrane lipoprotein-sorting protein